jgi:hypothetical protein
MTLYTFHGSPIGTLSANPFDEGLDVDTGNFFVCTGGTAWNEVLSSPTQSAAWGGLVSTTALPVQIGTGTVPWVTLTVANLNTYLEASVLSVLQTKDLAAGQTDRFTQAMLDVTAKIRARIQSVPGCVVSATVNSVPPELVDVAVKLILLAIQAAYPALGLTKDQLTDFNKAWKELDTLQSKDGKQPPILSVSMPPDPLVNTVQGVPRPAVIHSTRRQYQAHTLRGI